MRNSESKHDILREQYESRRPLYQELAENLEGQVRAAVEALDHIDRIEFRVKDTDSFLEKCRDPELIEPYDEPLVDVEDQVAGRIIVFFLDDIERVAAEIEERFNPVEFERHRPEKDAEFGYESEHRICRIPPPCEPEGWEEADPVPNTFELQIRTLFMHAYAEPQHDFAYKAVEELTPSNRRELAWIAASAWGADRAFQRVYDRQTQPSEAGGSPIESLDS